MSDVSTSAPIVGLRFGSSQTLEALSPYAWSRQWVFTINAAASDADLVAAYVAHPEFVTNIHRLDEREEVSDVDTHGPYVAALLCAEDFQLCDRTTAEAPFREWIAGFNLQPGDTYAPEAPEVDRHLDAYVRPWLNDSDLYLLRDIARWNGPRDAIDPREKEILHDAESVILLGWIEAVAINRSDLTLTAFAISGD